MKTLSVFFVWAAVLLAANACNRGADAVEPAPGAELMSKSQVARMLSSLPIGSEQMSEVYEAVSASSGNGYDEEYMMADLLTVPGAGVGSDRALASKAAAAYGTPIKSLIEDYLAARIPASTKAGAAEVEDYLESLKSSGMQIYWPFSELWDGESLPLITYDPGDGSESNYAYVISSAGGGYEVVDSVFVDENLARKRPVWVINQNDDSHCTPLSSLLIRPKSVSGGESEGKYNLYIKDITMLRNYDSWFAGASEFHIWSGGVDGFYASTEEELRNYNPTVTDFVVVVKRYEVGIRKAFNALLVSDFSEQLEKLAFLVVEDDGGTQTNWKCSATVKVKSKSYGFDVNLPLNTHDDVVWRGQLSAGYFPKGKSIEGRFGDVKITFALE
ncbi:MAG: hypothetical protein K6F21_02150 [Bacteroidales bacterium]|nr:hypothetical protein [Bacteroidales bacterium]